VCDAEGRDAVSSGRTLGPVTTIALLVGGAALATGVVLVVVGNKKSAAALETSVGPARAGASLRFVH
jgi:hypothetical protein